MWHHDHFVLDVNDSESFIGGKVTIGDSVEDEWFLISLLFKISDNIDNIVIQVGDQDGEVFLIEAADHLPKWAQDPETSDNRTYIYKNRLHLIPVAQNPSQ